MLSPKDAYKDLYPSLKVVQSYVFLFKQQNKRIKKSLYHKHFTRQQRKARKDDVNSKNICYFCSAILTGMDNDYDILKERALGVIATRWTPKDAAQEQLLRDTVTVQIYEKNEIIYQQMEPPTFLSYLIDGKVKICKDGVASKDRIIRVIKPRDPFGYRAFFDNQNYTTAAMALEDSLVAKIPLSTVDAIMHHNYDFCMSLIKHLASELGKSDTRTINLTQKHVRGRLAEALVFLKDSYGTEEDGCTLSVRLSRAELADISNMTTNNAIRTLSAFASEKLVAVDGRKIKIIEDGELRRISDFG